MEYNFSNSKFFYEIENNSIIVRKRFLTSSNAITTFIFSLILIIAFTQILFDQDVYNNVLEIIIAMFLFSLYFFIYSLLSLFWMPKLYIFNYDHFLDCKTNKKYFYDQIDKIEVASHISSATFRVKYNINHLCLEIHLSNSKIITVIDIEDKKISEELNNFKILIKNLIFKSRLY